MIDQVFEDKLAKLSEVIDTLPDPVRQQLSDLVEETRDRYTQIHESMTRSRNGLDDLRLRLKYLLFDAEAQRREATENRSNPDDSAP